jgi:hypothetical protein
LANWPNAQKAAVVISFDVERSHETDLKKVIEILNNYEADATFFVVAGYYEDASHVLASLEGFEVASKGWDQGTWSNDIEMQRDSIKASDEFLVSQGYNPVGFRAPFLRNSEETFEVLSELGYEYDSSDDGLLPSKQDDLNEIPLSLTYDPFWNEEVKDYLPLLYLTFENTYDKDGLFMFYTLPEHVDEKWELFLDYISEKDVWLASGKDVSLWWDKRSNIELEIRGKNALVTNNGGSSISGVTLKTNEGYKPLPEIKSGETIKVTI